MPEVEIEGRSIAYRMCRVLPDTALVLRDVLREAQRLWIEDLGPEGYERLRGAAAGEDFFTARVRLEPVPPEREMVAVWLPFPPDFRRRVRPQLIDYVEAADGKGDAPHPPSSAPSAPV